MDHDGKVRPAAQSDAFRQTCRDTINFTVNSQIDECADGSLNKCDPNAVCTDTQEGYECACNAGFLGTGFMRDFEPKAGCTADPSVPKTSEELSLLSVFNLVNFKHSPVTMVMLSKCRSPCPRACHPTRSCPIWPTGVMTETETTSQAGTHGFPRK